MSKRLVLGIGGAMAAVAVAVGLWFYFHDPSPAPLVEIHEGDRIVLLGNTFAERMQHFGHFETLLHSRFPDKELVVRNLGYSGDEITDRTRPHHFDKHGNTLSNLAPDLVLACFGFNESFAGSAGLNRFEKNLDKYISDILKPPSGQKPPRLVLVSPIAFEDLERAGLPDGKQRNRDLQLYSDAIRRVAAQRGIPFVDLFEPSKKLMAESPTKLTINGIHLSDEGYWKVATILDEKLFGPRPSGETGGYERLRTEINAKNLLFWYDHRAANGNFIYGAHVNEFGKKNFPEEFRKLRKMIAARDRRIWSIAQWQTVPETLDPDVGGKLSPIPTTLERPPQILSPAEALESFKLAEGFEINLFASEVEFPELRNPVAMAFDANGRLWVTSMLSYPLYLPGQPANDKVLILEDTEGDGQADSAKVFADGLYLPTGIALGDGGAYVGCQPNVWFLEDTDGTGKADRRERILQGFGNTDSHRAVNTFRWGPDGALYFNEGVYNYTQVETPYGPLRNFNGGIYRYRPRSEKLDLHVNYKFGNPWGHVWDRWGHDFIADAADGSNYYATPMSGRVDYPKKHEPLKTIFEKKWRPTCGCTFVSSRNFPDAMQGDYLLNNTMDFQGILRYTLKEEGAGFTASPAEPLLQSSDPNFRPVDLQFGPDGALYVCDWYNPIIAYINTSLRDPNRDKKHGRIWRITYKEKPLVPRPAIAGASISKLLEHLKLPEDYTRGQARRELRSRDVKQVLAELDGWITRLDEKNADGSHHLLEALWVCQHLDTVNSSLLLRLLRSPKPQVRAAATHVLWDWRDRLPNALELLAEQAKDVHPRVRLEVLRALSFFEDERAREIAKSVSTEEDEYLKYTKEETLTTLER